MKKKKKKQKGVKFTPGSNPPPPERINRKRATPRPGSFVSGLTLGFMVALAAVVVWDMGWLPIPIAPNLQARTVHDDAGNESEAVASLFLSGPLPADAHVYVDGRAVETLSLEDGVQVPISEDARRVEVRGLNGTWWTTTLPPEFADSDTLKPNLGGDLVVELERHAGGGELFLDGLAVGTAPGTVSDVPPGWHILSVREKDRVQFEDGFVVRPGEVMVVRVPPVAPQGKGRLVVRSRVLEDTGFTEIQGNAVIVDGYLKGETPLNLTLPAGFHSVRIESPAFPSRVEVIYLEAGAARYVDAEFGREQRLQVEVNPPLQIDAQTPLALPVRVEFGERSVLLKKALLHLVRPGQAKSVEVPLVPSGTDPKLWVAALPLELIASFDVLSGYATCTDDRGRTGDSDLFRLRLR